MTLLSGSCLCGAVKFEVNAEHDDDGVHIDVCHCSMCQRQLGGPLFGVTLDGPPRIADDSTLQVFGSSQWAERMFCKTCGSNLFFRMKDGDMYTVHAGALDKIPDPNFSLEIFTDDKPDYYDFAGCRKRMTGEEAMAAFASGQSVSAVRGEA